MNETSLSMPPIICLIGRLNGKEWMLLLRLLELLLREARRVVNIDEGRGGVDLMFRAAEEVECKGESTLCEGKGL